MKGSHKLGIILSAVGLVTALVIVVIVITPSPGDEFTNSDPVLNVPVSSPINLNRNQMTQFTVTASDPDNATQSVTLSAVWSGFGQNPFTFGATFNPTTGLFRFRGWVFGPFGVRFQATDNYTTPGTDSEDITINVAPSPVVVNEFRYLGTGVQDIELHNRNATGVSIDGWILSINPTANYTFAGVSIPANSYIVLHWNQSGTDTATHYYTDISTTLTPLIDEGTIVLYSHSNLTVNDIVDGVSWNTGVHTFLNDLVTSGHWPGNTSGEAIDVGSYAAGNSFAYNGAGHDATSWALDATPTFGVVNS